MEAPAVPNLTAPRPTPPGRRDLAALPKAHLHLHFTGAMRPTTMVEMARTQGVRLPPHLLHIDAASMPADGRGWFRFQRAYDSARHLVRSEAAMRRLIREAAEDDAAEGSVRMEIQADPTSYAPYVGGITPALEIIIDEARAASRDTGVDIGVIVAASRMKHPLDARTLARLAASFAGDGPGEVVGFGLSNDERVGSTASFAPAFRIARRAGLVGVPHGGELLEVCPTSNVHLGVYTDFSQVPLPTLLSAGARIALAADDPLLFRSRLVAQYEVARDVFGLSDEALADLARSSIDASLASPTRKAAWKADIDAWLAAPVA